MATLVEVQKAIARQEKLIEAERGRINDDYTVLQAEYHELRQEDAPRDKLMEKEAEMDEMKAELIKLTNEMSSLRIQEQELIAEGV